MEIFEVTESNANIDKKELYTYIDNTEFSNEIKESIKGMLGVVLSSGDNDINLDFDDLKVIMSHGSKAFSGIGEYEGKNSATQAIKLSIENSSLDYSLMDKISGMLIHFVVHPDLPIMEIAEAMEIIDENAHDESDIIWGTTTDKSVSANYVKATILFTGYEKDTVANNIEYK
ncbi:MAG: hypothetical protein JJW00_08385 [Sulfurimonas sp.]|nr:hypothetical protein [Sulfurimonas sp.]